MCHVPQKDENTLRLAVVSCMLPPSGPAALQGARSHLQAGFLRYMHGQVNRNRGAAQRGADPDPLRDVQAYIMVKYKDKGPLDLVAGPGGLDTTWAQVHISNTTRVFIVGKERALKSCGFSGLAVQGCLLWCMVVCA